MLSQRRGMPAGARLDRPRAAAPNNPMLLDIGIVVAGYLAGSVASAIIVCKLLGLPDPRQEGSRNPGATNVLRLGGRKAAVVTLLGDYLKGLLPVLVAKALPVDMAIVVATGLAAFIGHLYPVFFRFEGGKGVATAFGVVTGFAWPVAAAMAATWLAMAVLFRYSSLASLTSAVLVPLYAWLLTGSATLAAGLVAMTVLVTLRHRQNITRLLAGNESRIGEKSGTAKAGG